MSTIPFADLINQAGETGPVPEGTYDVRVASASYKKTSNGKDMWNVRFEVVGGPKAGSTIFNNFVLSPENPNALGFFFRHMAALGLDAQFFATNPTPEQIVEKLNGSYATVTVTQQERAGAMRNNVEKLVPYTGQQQAPAAAAPFPGAPAQSTVATPQTPAAGPIQTAPSPAPTPEQAAAQPANGVQPAAQPAAQPSEDGPKLPF